ncbi:MAG: terpene cyclase/mutase family protein [Phycisphaerae bacterium]|nr:terpene cyclase/mutase family protein [Phycisphaerae bacterium]
MKYAFFGMSVLLAVAAGGWCDEPAKAQPSIDGKVLSLPPAPEGAMDAAHAKRAGELINRGLAYLASKQQPDGGWSIDGAFTPAVTALAAKAFVQHPDFNSQTPRLKKAYGLMLRYQQPDGAIYDPKEGRSNYCTAIALTGLAAANDPAYKPAIDKAVAYLRTLQIQPGAESPDGKKITEDHPYLGGVSYGEHGRPDLNNLGWWMEGMHSAGVPADDPAMQRALHFVVRCQNRSESNPLPWAAEGPNDGGFIYAPAQRDVRVAESKAGPGPAGKGLTSYGSISYVGWKSLLYAGLKHDDPRVQGVYTWIRRHWTLAGNPNMPKDRSQEGVYYYYLAFARALRAWGENQIPSYPEKTTHNWREELVDELARRVHPDGSFCNEKASRWSEGNPVLVTAYEVQALQEAMKK